MSQFNVPQIPYLEDKFGAYIQNISFGDITVGEIKAMDVVVVEKAANKVTVLDENGNAIQPAPVAGDELNQKGVLKLENTNNVVTVPFNKLVVDTESGVGLKYTASVLFDGVAELEKQINSAISTQIKSVKDAATSKLAAIDTKIINRLNKVVNVFNDKFHNLNYYLQPMLFVGDDNGDLFRLSEVLAAATPVAANGNSAQLWFHPTSGTAELLAPAYMKYVEVQTIQGGKATINDTDKNNITFNGKDNALLVKFEKGVYRVIYQAVDFYGYTSTKVYYVNVN